ncbi:MAG: protein kinase [Gemmatimonadota bacterium]
MNERLAAALVDRYVIAGELGQGGMATVYLAHDLKHDRKVALKVLKPELAAVIGADRFVVEIKTTAALQHPHILPLFDSGSADGFLYYVMPYIEGETLRGKLDRETQFGIEEAVKITVAVADALDYAHRHGVIHRDIKPENILLHDGRPIVADFGIALALSAAAGGRMTETGMSLGTPHYMSPEQATADKEITGRSDIYSLGSVLFEMLTGEPPHMGKSAQQIIMKIVSDEARPVTELRKAVPPNVAAAVAKSLEKLPADRFGTAKEFAEALGDRSFSTAATRAGRSTASAPQRLSALQWAIVAAVFGLAGLLAGSRIGRAVAPPPRDMRFTLTFPDSARFVESFGPSIAISPDGKMLVYTGGSTTHRELFLRRFDDLRPTPIAGTEGAYMPFFSPDGEWLGFVANQRLMKIRVSGGTPIVITSLLGNIVSGATWSRADVILLEDVSGLSRVSAGGGPLVLIAPVDSMHQLLEWPSFLPAGDAALFTVTRKGVASLGLLTLADGQVTVFDGVQGTNATYHAPGYVTWATGDGVFVVAPFDAGQRRFTGPARTLLDHVAVDGEAAKVAVGPGVMVQVEGGASNGRLLRLDRRGNARPEIPDELGFDSPRYSPDGRRIAVGIFTSNLAGDLWVVDRTTRTLQRITFTGSAGRPEWSRDGRRIAFGFLPLPSSSWEVYGAPADGSGSPDSLVISPGTDFPYAWTGRGDTLIYLHQSAATRGDILYVRPGSAPQVFAGTPANESHAALSPDGRWLAYVSDESGRREVNIRPFPTGAGRWQVSAAGGIEPRWSRYGNEIIYRSGDLFLAVSVTTRPVMRVSRPDTLFRGQYPLSAIRASYDVSADGNEIIIVGPIEGVRQLTVRLDPLAAVQATPRDR